MSAPFNGKTFSNPGTSTDRSLLQVLRWATSGERKAWPRWVENRTPFAPFGAVPAGQVALTFVNHATFLIRSDRLAILTDPVWSKRASPLQWMGPARVRHPGVPFDELPSIAVASRPR